MKIFNQLRIKIAGWIALLTLFTGLLLVWGINTGMHYYRQQNPLVARKLWEEYAVDMPEDFEEFKQDRLDSSKLIHAADERRSEELLTMSYLALVPFTLIAFISGYYLAGRIVAPISELNLATMQVDLDKLAPISITKQNSTDEIGTLIANFNKMIDRLDKSNLSREQFIQDASHELKTPLTIIKTNLELLDSDDDPTLKDYRQVSKLILKTVDNLDTLSEDLLLLANQKGLKVDYKRINVSKLLEQIVKKMKSVASIKGLELKFQNSNKPIFIAGSLYHLEKAFQNLIDNAIKYSKSGKIEVSISVKDTVVCIRIKDQGIGITKKEIDKIFDRFYRGDKARNIRQGSGLGLAIVKEIIDNHDGEIKVFSRKGRGTQFIVFLTIR